MLIDGIPSGRKQLKQFDETKEMDNNINYMKEYRLLLPREECILFFCDEKAMVHVGEPGIATSTGVCGKKSIGGKQGTKFL